MKKLIFILSTASILASSCLAYENERDFGNLTWKEKKDLAIAQRWIRRQTTTISGPEGEVVFLFGAAMPSVIAAPLRLTDINLQEGEEILDVQIGDSVRWQVSLSLSGKKPKEISHVILKPVARNLQTTLNIMTNRRVYRLNLISDKRRYMPAVAFAYPSEIIATLEAYKAKLAKKSEQKNFYKTKGQKIPSNIDNLDFGYKVSGAKEFLPLRVYNDGVKTYIQMAKNLKFYEAPVLMVLDSSRRKEIVNYRVKYDTYIVDRLFDKAVLISNVGLKQEKVTITKKSSKNNKEVLDNVIYDLSLTKGKK